VTAAALFPAFALMTALAVVALLWPVFRRPRPASRAGFEVEVYRDQLAEVDRDRERALIAPDEARAARLEIQRRLLRATADPAEGAAAAAPDQGSGRRGVALAAALLAPTLAAALYAGLGSPGLPDRPLASREDRQPDAAGQPDVRQMVAGLEARLAREPDDLEGWLMLARSRGALGNMPAAIEAYRRAQGLAADDPRVVGGLGEALMAAGGGVVTPEARGLFARLAGIEPRDPRAAFYLGWASFQAGDHHVALEGWRRLLATTPADAPWRPRVVEAVRAAAQELELDPDAVLAQIPAPPAAAPAAPQQPSAEDVARAAEMPPGQQAEMIRGMVDKLQARMDADGSDAEGWLRLAQSRLVLGEDDRARATFEKALSLHPDDPELVKGYAATLVGPIRGDTGLPEIGDRAAELFTKAAGLRPDDPEPWYYLGIRALQDGRKDEARTAWRKVLAHLDPSQPVYQSIKSRLEGLGS
jgi:cytochrome c-type biogenesis protein CcmH